MIGKCPRCEALKAQLEYTHKIVDQLLQAVGAHPTQSQFEPPPGKTTEERQKYQVGIIHDDDGELL